MYLDLEHCTYYVHMHNVHVQYFCKGSVRIKNGRETENPFFWAQKVTIMSWTYLCDVPFTW